MAEGRSEAKKHEDAMRAKDTEIKKKMQQKQDRKEDRKEDIKKKQVSQHARIPRNDGGLGKKDILHGEKRQMQNRISVAWGMQIAVHKEA